jgi:hypothetical protein
VVAVKNGVALRQKKPDDAGGAASECAIAGVG